jgi:hypothetical protein
MSKICVLAEPEAEEHWKSRKMPPCKEHRHVSAKVADGMTSNLIGDRNGQSVFEAYWTSNEHKAIFLEPSPRVVDSIVPWRWRHRRSGAEGPVVMQLTR